MLKTKFLIIFHCLYDVIQLHQVPQIMMVLWPSRYLAPGVTGANFVGRHLLSVPKGLLGSQKNISWLLSSSDYQIFINGWKTTIDLVVYKPLHKSMNEGSVVITISRICICVWCHNGTSGIWSPDYNVVMTE